MRIFACAWHAEGVVAHYVVTRKSTVVYEFLVFRFFGVAFTLHHVHYDIDKIVSNMMSCM